MSAPARRTAIGEAEEPAERRAELAVTNVTLDGDTINTYGLNDVAGAYLRRALGDLADALGAPVARVTFSIERLEDGAVSIVGEALA